METKKQSYSTLIVDDEPLAREKLKKQLEEFSGFSVTGEADCVEKAREFMGRKTVDLVLLDIQLAGESGFELVPFVPEESHIIFVTAYDEYAVRAFEVNALDYLLKPVRKNRLSMALEKVTNGKSGDEIPRINHSYTYDDTIFISTQHVCKFLKISRITSIDAEGSYSRVYEDSGENYLMNKSLNEWISLLDPAHFVRIHRSHIVNMDHITGVEKWFNYTYRVQVKGRKDKLPMSRRRANELKLT